MKATWNRVLSLVLALTMCLSLLPATAFAADENPWTDYAQAVTPNAEGVYEISTAAQLAWLAKSANDGSVTQQTYDASWNKTRTVFRLTADIDLSAHQWVPIGFGYDSKDNRRFFYGSFDGGGHTITGMRVGSAASPYTDNRYAGLFGYVLGEISDLKVTDAAVYAGIPGESDPYTFAGLIAGELDGEDAAIRYCEASGTVCTGGAPGSAANAAAGGIVGELYEGTVESCRADVTLGVLTEGRNSTLGGIAGVSGEYMTTLIQNCVSSVTVSAENDYHLSGTAVAAITAHGYSDSTVRNSVGVADCGGMPADSVYCAGTKQNVVSVSTNVVSRETVWDDEKQAYVTVDTPHAPLYCYYDGDGVESETVNTEAAMKSADFLDTLNTAAAEIDGAQAWSAGSDGFPTIPKAGIRDYYTVTFSSAGQTYATRTVPDGTAVSMPAAPERKGYTFLWWYADDPETPYDFSAPVTEPLTLTAAWDAHGYTVLFDSMGGSYVYPQAVKQDQRVTVPEQPERKDSVFGGWYTDEACTAAWNFNAGVQGDMTLYARWTEAGGVSVTGRITDASTGKAVDGASVALSNGQNALSDELGYYRISNVADGTYTIAVTANGYVDETTAGFTVSGVSAGYDAALTPDAGDGENTVTIYATVSCVYSAMMLKGVTVKAVGQDAQGRTLGPYAGVTDAKGNVTFTRIPAGKYTFTINETGRPGWESYTSAQTESLSGHYSLQCALKPNYQTLTVTVTGYDPVKDEDNVPLKDKTIQLTGLDPEDKTKQLCRVNMTTDENGVIVFDHAVPITWEITCRDASYQTVTEYVYADAVGHLTKNAVALRLPFINSSVTVNLSSVYSDPDIFKKTGGDGSGAADSGRAELGVQLAGIPGTMTEGILREAKLDKDGKAVFEKLVAGNYDLTASGSVKRYVSVPANDGKEIYSSSEDTRYGPKYFYADFYGTGSASVALGESSKAAVRVQATPVSFSGTLLKSDMNEDGTITTVPLPNTKITIMPSPYYRLNDEPAEGYEIETDENGFYSVTLAPGLYGVTVEDKYSDYFGGHLIYHEGMTDTCYYDYEVRGWPCAGRWTGSRQSAWAWLSSGDQQPYGDIAGMNLSSGTVVADLELMQKVFRYNLGDANNISFVGIPRMTNAEMHLIVDYRKEDGEYTCQTVDYNTESRGASVTMSGAMSASMDMTGQRFPASFNVLKPGDYTFTYQLGNEFSHLRLSNWTPQTRARLPYDGVKQVTFYDFPAPGRLPDAGNPFPEDYVDIRYPNDGAKNPWPLQTVEDDEVGVEFAQGEGGRRTIYDLHDDDPSNGELWFKFKNLNRYTQKTLDFQPVEVAEGVYRNYGQEELEKMQDDPETYADLHLVSQSGHYKTYGWCPPDEGGTKNREHWDEEYSNDREIWNMLFAYTTDKIPGKLFYINSQYDEWDKTLTGLPDGNVTLYFCAEQDSWGHEILVGNGGEARNKANFPAQDADLWFAVDVPANGDGKHYDVDFARKDGAGNGFRFVTKNEINSLVHPRAIKVQAVESENNVNPLDVPVSVTTADNHTFKSGQTYADQTCTSALSAVTVDSKEWECKGYLYVADEYDESTKTETFLVPLTRKQYAHKIEVKDDAGQPVKNADITIWGDRFDPVVVHTGGDGTAQAGEYGYYPGGYQMKGGLYYQDYTVKVTANGYGEERYELSADQVAAGEARTVTLRRAAQPEFTADRQTLDKKGAFIPGVHYAGSSSQLEFFTEAGQRGNQFWLDLDAEITVPEGQELKALYLVDRRSFALEDSANSEPVYLNVPSTLGEAYNPSQVWEWLEKVRSGGFGKVYLQEFANNSVDIYNPFEKDKEYSGPGTRYIFHGFVPLWELPVGGFEPSFIAVTSKGAVQIYDLLYSEAASYGNPHKVLNEKEQLVGVRLDGDMAGLLNWLASLANVKALGGEAALRGMETLMQHTPVVNTPTGTFVPNVTFTANVTEDADGYLNYTYEIKGELTQGTTITSYASNSYAAYLPTATGLIAIGAWNLSMDGKGRTLDSGYSVEVKGGQLDATNYAPKGLQAMTLNVKDKATGFSKFVILPVNIEFEVMDPPSGLMSKTEKEIFDKDNVVVEHRYLISAAGRVNVKLQVSGFKAADILAPGVGKVLGILADRGALDMGVEARGIAGANFTMDLGPFFYDNPGELFEYDKLGVGVGVRLGFYAKALGEALVANATVGLSGDNPTPKLSDMLTLTVKPKVVLGIVMYVPTEIQGKVDAKAHILVRTWFINGEKDFVFAELPFKYEFNTETQFNLAQIGVTGTMQSRDDFTPSSFNGRPETVVNDLLPIGGYAMDDAGTGAFVYTDMETKGGAMRLLLSEYAGSKVWNTPAVIAETDGLIPACDVLSLGGGRYLAVWTEIDKAHMQETCPPSVVKYSVGAVENGSWTGSAETLDTLPAEVASRLMLVSDGANVFLAALRTAEGAIAEHWSVSGYRFDGEAWNAATELVKEQEMADVAACAANGALIISYTDADSQLVTAQWSGGDAAETAFDAVMGQVALASDGANAYLVCKAEDGLNVYRLGEAWTKLGTVTDRADAGNPALTVSDESLIVSWTAGTETGDAETLDNEALHDVDLYSAVLNTDGTPAAGETRLKETTSGRFRDSTAIVLDNEILVMTVLDDSTDRLNVYSGGAVPGQTKPKVTGTVTGSAVAYTVENLPETGAKLIAARYDGGKMTDVKLVDDPGAAGTVTLGGSGAKFKLFLVDSSGFKPLCRAWESP